MKRSMLLILFTSYRLLSVYSQQAKDCATERLRAMEQAKEHPEIYVPGCDPDGTWSAFQYWAGGQEWWCVTAEGEYVNGTLHYADAPDPQFCDQYRTTTSTSTTPNPGKRVKGKKKGF